MDRRVERDGFTRVDLARVQESVPLLDRERGPKGFEVRGAAREPEVARGDETRIDAGD